MSTGPDPEGAASPIQVKEERKRRHKEEKVRREAQRLLDGWQRLRVLTDLVDEERKVIETADHKARFALVIMGAVNAALLLVGTRDRVIESIPASVLPWLVALLVPYGLVTFGFLLHAIEVLRPHVNDHIVKLRREGHGPGEGLEDRPLGLFHWTDILHRDLEEYQRLWSQASVGQVNAELTTMAHVLAHVNNAQNEALRQLFRGLQVMTILAAVVLALLSVFAFR